MRGSLSRVVLIKFQGLLNKGFIKNLLRRGLQRICYPGLVFSDTVASTVAPVLGKSRCTTLKSMQPCQACNILRRLCNLSPMLAARQSSRENQKPKTKTQKTKKKTKKQNK